jgi:type II secretory pathway component PulF
LVALVEPAVILAMGLVVGTIVVSTLLAIVSINEVPF